MRALGSLLGLIVFTASPVTEAQTDTAHSAFVSGLAAEKAGDAQLATQKYLQALELDPEHGRALINLGLLEIRARNRDGEARCQRALDLDAEAAKAHYCIGLGALLRKEPVAAATAFENSVRLDPSAPIAHVELAHLRRKAKQHDAAVELYRKAVRLDANAPDLHVHLGYCYKALGKFPAAEVEYRKAVQKDAKSFYGHLNLGWVLAHRKNYLEAREHYVAASELDPKHADPHFNLGNLYQRTGQLHLARDHFGEASKLAPADAAARLGYARMLWRTGNTPAAKVELEKTRALNLTPREKKNVQRLARAFDGPAPRLVDVSKNQPDGPARDVKTKADKPITSKSPSP